MRSARAIGSSRGAGGGALASLRAVQSSPNLLHAGEATRQAAEILQREGRAREAYDEYARLVLMTRGTNYANSRVSDGLIHARMASIALDLDDDALFGRAVRDLALQMGGTTAQIQEEGARRRARLPGRRGDEAARRFEAQIQDMREAAASPPLVTRARALAQDGDIRTLSWRVAQGPKMSEAQEEREAIEKLARLRGGPPPM